jgi:hypothetical protein
MTRTPVASPVASPAVLRARNPWLALAAAVLSALPTSVAAAPAPAPIDAPAIEGSLEVPDDPAAPARAHFAAGLRAYEIGQYDTAAEEWTAARASLADVPDHAHERQVLAFDLARAHLRAYELDGQADRLSRIVNLLDGYLAHLRIRQEQLTATERQDYVRASEMLAEATRLRDREPSPAPAAVVVAPAPVVDRPPPPVDPRAPRRAKREIIAGGVLLGVGVGSLATSIGLMSRAGALEEEYEIDQQRRADDPSYTGDPDIERRGAANNRAIIGLACVGVASTIVGTALLVTGLVGRRRARTVALSGGPGQLGIGLAGRF